MPASPARVAALEVLTRVRERSAYAHETLDTVLRSAKLNPRDTAFATRIAYGAVATRGTLDDAVATHVSKSSALEPRVADALALATYELLYAATPARAAVSEGVELVRSVQPKAAGLANAVLRKVAESAADFPWGDPATDTAALARLYGHPLWIAERWVDELGFEKAAEVMAANNEPAPLFMAHLPFGGAFETAMDELARAGAEPDECFPAGCIRAGVPSAAIKSTALARKLVIVADAGAQFAAQVVRPVPDMRIAEVGAGRGTKTLLMAGMAAVAGGTAQIKAFDIHGFKLDALKQTAKELTIAGISVKTGDTTDPAVYAEFEGSFDAVLVDAPCSGLGTLRRHPDRRWRARPEEIDALAELGTSLLEAAARLVKPGGFVVYSTCTIVRRENEQVVEGFLGSSAGKGFTPDPLNDEVPAQWAHFVTPEGWFRSLPEPGGPDGHFVARLKRG